MRRRDPHLTAREVQVLTKAMELPSNAEIAKAMYLSEDTIKTHLRRAFAKLGAESRTDAIFKAIRLGYIPCPCSLPPPARF